MGLASRGLRDMGGGPESIEDDLELEAVRRQAREIRTRAMTVAVGGSILALLPP